MQMQHQHPGLARLCEAKETPHLRLLCVPYSGGDASSFRSWGLEDQYLEVWSVRLPGRANRAHEKPFNDWRAAVNEIVVGLQQFFLDGVPFAILGHSLGALLGFEVIRSLAAQGLPQPILFLTSSHAPPWKKISGLEGVSDMKPSEMLPLLSKLGILSKEVSAASEAPEFEDEALSVFLPALKADLEMYNNYCCNMPPFNFGDTAVAALIGLSDAAVSLEDMEEWGSFCQSFEVKAFAGGHFYWQGQGGIREEVQAYLADRLRRSLRTLPRSVHSRFGCVESPSQLCALTTLISRHPPNSSTIEDKHEKISLGELRARSHALARGLGDVHQATVATLLHHDIAFVTAMLAIWQSNACMMVLDKSFPPALVAESLALAGVRVLLVAADLLHKVNAEGIRVVTHERHEHSGAAEWKGLSAPLFSRTEDFIDLESPAYLVFTSGTSGKPKMVVSSHRSATFGHLSRAHLVPYSAGEKEGVNIMFSWEVLRGIVQGTDVACIPDSAVTDPSAFLDFIEQRNITRFLATPSLLRTLLDALGAPEQAMQARVLRALKVVYSCGEALPAQTARKFRSSFPEATLVNVYSSWEGGDLAIYKVPDSVHRWPQCCSVAPVGCLLPHTACAILDGSLQPVPAGVVGSLYVASEGLSDGYFNDQQLTQMRLLSTDQLPAVKDLLEASFPHLQEYHQRLSWYQTGDLGRLHLTKQQPVLEVCGRGDNTVKLRGYKVGLSFVEEAVNRLPQVSASVVVPVLSKSSGQPESLLCYYEAVDSSGSSGSSPGLEKAMRAQLQQSLPRWAVPAHFRRLPWAMLSGSESRKIDRRRLAVLAEDLQVSENSERSEAHAADLNPMEVKVAEVWSVVLGGTQSFEKQHDFFDYGASLEFAALSSTLKRMHGIEVPVNVLMAASTLEAMAMACFKVCLGEALEAKPAFNSEAEASKFPLSTPSDASRDVLEQYKGKKKKCALLTGCTGFVGVHIMKKLCCSPAVSAVVCLVRGRDDSAVEQRLDDVCRTWFPQDAMADAVWMRKIQYVRGDVSEERFGLDPHIFQAMKTEVDVVFHVAAEVNMLKPYEALVSANVTATAHVLNFCAEAGAPLLFTSTVEPSPTERPTGYRQSKEVAEKLCLRSRGVPSAVFQLGDIGMGSGRFSKVPESDFIVILLRACVLLGKRPHANWAVSILSIERLVDYMADLASDPGLVFDSVPRKLVGARLPWNQLCEWLEPELPMKPCSLDAWKRAVAEASDPGVQRLQLLLPGMEAEFQAEFHAESHVSAELPDLSVDEAWARNLGRALRVSTESTKSGTATDATVSVTLPGFARLERKRPLLQSLQASRASAERGDAVDSVDSVDSVDAWVCPGPGQELVQRKMPLPLLRPETVEIQVTHCGLCGSDVHLIDGDWGDSSVYPQVCGHEIVGLVTAKGSAVTNLRIGSRVGVGWQKGSCLQCRHCFRGNEQFCEAVVCTCCDGEQGGFCTRFRADSRFCFLIPDGLSSAHAAPLLCAGHTVYTALLGAEPGQQVGILGIGGLGHLAIQFATKRGCIVTALSSSAAKEAEAKRLGASNFLLASDYPANAGTLDFVLVCGNHSADWKGILNMLAPQGAICFVGAVAPITFDTFTMGFKGLRVLTSNTGGRKEMIDMLDFAAQKRVVPMVQSLPIAEINAGVAMLRKGSARYRIVFSMPQHAKL